MGGVEPQDRSIARHIAGLESEELMRVANALEDLQRSAGWAVLQELVGIEKGRIRRTIEARALDNVQTYAHAGGAILGMNLPDRIITDVLETAAEVRAALENPSD